MAAQPMHDLRHAASAGAAHLLLVHGLRLLLEGLPGPLRIPCPCVRFTRDQPCLVRLRLHALHPVTIQAHGPSSCACMLAAAWRRPAPHTCPSATCGVPRKQQRSRAPFTGRCSAGLRHDQPGPVGACVTAARDKSTRGRLVRCRLCAGQRPELKLAFQWVAGPRQSACRGMFGHSRGPRCTASRHSTWTTPHRHRQAQKPAHAAELPFPVWRRGPAADLSSMSCFQASCSALAAAALLSACSAREVACTASAADCSIWASSAATRAAKSDEAPAGKGRRPSSCGWPGMDGLPNTKAV